MVATSEARRKRRNVEAARRTLDAFKLAKGCQDCGYREHPGALQFDHVDPRTKSRDLGWFEDRSKLHTTAKLLQFLEHVERYCQVRCANCHAVRSIEEEHWRPTGQPKPSPHPALF
jgi:hypothetical protein